MFKKRTRLFSHFNLINFFHILKAFLYKNKNFKNELKTYLKTDNIELTSQGRTALYDIIKQIVLTTGKKIIHISPYTIPEVIYAIRYAGAEVNYIDINKFTGLINEDLLEKEINERTAAVLITHLYSTQDHIKNFFKRFEGKILVIEDAAINFGAQIDNKYLGTIGDYGFFSFNLVKNLNTLNGGAIYIRDKNLFKNYIESRKVSPFPIGNSISLLITNLIIKILSNNYIYQFFHYLLILIYKKKSSFFLKKIYPINFHKYYSTVPKNYSYDFNWLMNDIGSYNLKRVNLNYSERIKKAALYSKLINNDCATKFNYSFKDNALLEYPIILKKITNKDLQSKLMNEGYDIRLTWYINNVENEEKVSNHKFSDTKFIEKYIFCLPLHKNINAKDIHNISSLINKLAS